MGILTTERRLRRPSPENIEGAVSSLLDENGVLVLAIMLQDATNRGDKDLCAPRPFNRTSVCLQHPSTRFCGPRERLTIRQTHQTIRLCFILHQSRMCARTPGPKDPRTVKRRLVFGGFWGAPKPPNTRSVWSRMCRF